MIREIEFLDDYGKCHKLHAIKHEEISKYEILLPEIYTMIVEGAAYCLAHAISPDLDMGILNDKNLETSGTITIVNHNPRRMGNMDIICDSYENDMSRFMNVVANCSVVCIHLTKEHELKQVMYYFQDLDGNDFPQYFWLFDDEGVISKDYLAKERY